MSAKLKTIFGKNKSDITFNIVVGFFMILISVIMLYPFLNVLAISLNDAYDSAAGGITIFPRKFSLASYINVFKYDNLLNSFAISVSRTLLTTLLSLIVTAGAAFALTKTKMPGYKPIYYFFVVSMFLPVLLMPNFMLYRDLGLYNSFWVYILPGLVWTYNIILFRTYIIQLPDGLLEASAIDGATDLQIFFKIVLPLSKPILATIGLFVAVREWNSWQDTLYYVTDEKLYTLQYVLQQVIKQAEATAIAAASSEGSSLARNLGSSVTPNSIRMAITIVATLPIVCVYPFLQKYFVKGTMIGAVKG